MSKFNEYRRQSCELAYVNFDVSIMTVNSPSNCDNCAFSTSVLKTTKTQFPKDYKMFFVNNKLYIKRNLSV